MAWALTAVIAAAPAVWAQQFRPSTGYVYPAGGRQGAEFEVTLGGQFLDGIEQAFVSGEGVRATVVEHVKPITQQQFNKLRERLQELQQKKNKTAAEFKEMTEIRQKLATFVRRPANPAIAETVTVRVKTAADAAPGRRELRLATPGGLTNPLAFYVGQLPEVSKQAAKSGDAPAGKAARYADGPRAAPSAELATVTLPAVLNGQIMPGTVDRYRIEARKGQRLVAVASARELIPYLPDAVPGWFQATLALFDAQGNEVAYADDYRYHPDPVLFYEVPADGQYVLEIKDAIYRGREDFVYRITVGELPFVTGVFPLGGKAGAKTAVALTGWNLPAEKLTAAVVGQALLPVAKDDAGKSAGSTAELTVNAKGAAPGVYPLSLRRGDLLSNTIPFSVDALPEALEQEPNDQPQKAQPVKLPLIVNGRSDRSGDEDVFCFEGRAGDVVVAEVMARRLGSPLDSMLVLTDAAGKQLAANDDCEDKGAGLETHHADSRLMAKLPADGTYYVHLRDVQHQGGAEYAYRLRIGPPQPDFELRVVPASVSVRGGASVALSVYALRKDGFAGEIALSLRDAPAGFMLGGGWVPAGQDKVRVTVTAPAAATAEPVSLHLEGRAAIVGEDAVRPAVPAEDMMQAFAYRHLVPADELRAAVSGRYAAKGVVRILNDLPLKLPAGGTARVRVGVPSSSFLGKIQLELSDPPEGISIRGTTSGRDGPEIVVQCDAKVQPGLKGNLIVQAFSANATAGKGGGQRPRVAVGTLPAIAFEIVAK
jgi:hypothetical protein